ncbi:MAG: class IV adenylate cyclase [Patescibacteria group bacterium]
MEHREVEVRFLEIDKEQLIAKLRDLGAKDLGEDMLEEVILYDKPMTWQEKGGKVLRLRTRQGKTVLTYKHHEKASVGGTEEIEFEVSDPHKAEVLLDRLGYEVYRHQQKKRHTFELGSVVVDIDTWPKIPTYVELEGVDEESLKATAMALDLDWKDVELRNPRLVLEEKYGIPIATMRWFTFDGFE